MFTKIAMFGDLTLTVPLTGIILVSCVKANASAGMAATAQLCRYGEGIEQFTEALPVACQALGIQVSEFTDLLID